MPPARRLRNSKPEDTAGDAFKKTEMFGEKRQNESLLNGTGGTKQILEDSSSSSSNNKNTSETEEDLAIGIDLGTTYSCVGVFQYGKVEIIANHQGFKTTPSYVAFTDEEILIGDAAKAQETRNLRSTIYGAKRLIGRQFFDAGVQTDIQNFPFEVINEDHKPKIKINVNGETKTFFPQEISAMVLVKMKETAEAYLGRPVQKAVITVPAYFNDAQRQATKDAAAIAKLEVLRIINEPTAAALAYGFEKKIESECYVMIFDLGGGTFDVSILNIDKDFFEVVSTTGDTHLGGEDFDNRMVNHFAEEFNRKYRKDLRQNKKAIRRLKTACEKVKRELSSSTLASLDLDSLHEGIDFYSSITRARFEELNADLFRKTLEPVEKCIRDARIDKSKIEEIVLVGGSTRIPKVQKLLSEFFNGKELSRSVNPDEAVAYGAAIQAALLNNDGSKEVLDLVLVDVTPLSLGVEVRDTKDMHLIVKRNTTIPTKQTTILTTMHDYQTSVCFKIFEGENPKTIYNNLLGKFTLTGIPPAPRQVPKFEVTFDIDASGILNVTAVNRETGNKNGITLTYNSTRFSQEEIDRMINDAQTYKEKLDSQKGLSAAKNSLESFCLDLKRTVLELQLDDFIVETDKQMIAKKCDEVIDWVISTDETEVEVFEQKQQELEDASNIVISIAKDPSLKEEKYRELLNLTSEANEEEIREGYRQATRKYHPDKFKGDVEIGKMMFCIAVNAEKFLTSLL